MPIMHSMSILEWCLLHLPVYSICQICQPIRFHFISISCKPFFSPLSIIELLLHEINIFRKIREANGQCQVIFQVKGSNFCFIKFQRALTVQCALGSKFENVKVEKKVLKIQNFPSNYRQLLMNFKLAKTKIFFGKPNTYKLNLWLFSTFLALLDPFITSYNQSFRHNI